MADTHILLHVLSAQVHSSHGHETYRICVEVCECVEHQEPMYPQIRHRLGAGVDEHDTYTKNRIPTGGMLAKFV